MNKTWLRLVVLTVPLVAVATVTFAASTSHAAGGGVIDPTCTSSLPCIEYDNNGSGPAIRGVGLGGNGVGGQTKFNSTSASNGKNAVGGSDLSTSGIYNSGVKGTTTRGTGVSGVSTSGSGVSGVSTSGIGVIGTSSSNAGLSGGSTSGFGVAGVSGSGTGVLGTALGSSSSVAGVEGLNNGKTTSIMAKGFGGPLFLGVNSHSVHVFTVDDGGNLGLTGRAGIGSGTSSEVSLNIGGSMYGVNSVGSLFGVVGYGGVAGVQGEASNSTASAVRAFSMGGLIYEGLDSSTVDVFEVDNGGNVHAHSFTSDLASTTGQRLVSYAPQASQPTIEDFGEAELTNGSAYVQLERRFASAMAAGDYLVFITPEGDNRGLYVTQKSATGFAVRESQGGHSTLAFSYRIVAKPLGNSQPRLPLDVQPRSPRPVLHHTGSLSLPRPT